MAGFMGLLQLQQTLDMRQLNILCEIGKRRLTSSQRSWRRGRRSMRLNGAR